MIISASRRTDIPAFYSEWFINRLKEGFAYAKNPMNPKQISKISLNKDVVDCIVFWTKNARPMLGQLDKIRDMGYQYYFQFTITPYDRSVEKHLDDKAKIIETFKELSEKIGEQRLIWRYDPVIVNDSYSTEYHLDSFYKICSSLNGYTSKCIFSFVDLYSKMRKSSKGIVEKEINSENMNKIAQGFSEISKRNQMKLETCSEEIDLSKYGIGHTSCIDKKTIEDIIGYSINAKKSQGQRQYCECIESIEIGAYDCCSHGCIYCYATSNMNKVYSNIKSHNSHSPLLIGKTCPGDKITEKEMKSLKNKQISFL